MAIAFQRPGNAIGMTIAWMAPMNGTVLLLPADLINLLVTMASASPNHTDAMVTTTVGTGLMNKVAVPAMVLSLLATMEIVSRDHTNATVTMIAAMDLMNETALPLLDLVARVICGCKMANLIAALQHTSVEKTKVTVMKIPIANLVLYAVRTTADLLTQDLMTMLTAV